MKRISPATAKFAEITGNFLGDILWRICPEWLWHLISPILPIWYFFLGLRFQMGGYDDIAIDCYQKAARMNPNMIETWLLLGMVYLRNGRDKEAEDCFEKASRIDPKFVKKRRVIASAYFHLGALYDKNRQDGKALDRYEKAIEVDPDFAGPYFNLGVFYAKRDDEERSIGYFEKVIEINPKCANAHYNLGFFHNQRGETRKAINCLEHAVNVNRKFVQAYSDLGALYSEQELEKKATRCLRKAIKINPGFAPAHYNLAHYYFSKNLDDKAEACLKEAIKMDPNFSLAYNNLGVLLAKKKQEDKAIGYFKKAIEINPSLAEAHFMLGWLYWQKDRNNEAMDLFARAACINPHFVEPFFFLGILQVEHTHAYKDAKSLFLKIVNKSWKQLDKEKARNFVLGAFHYASAMANWQNEDFTGAKESFLRSAKYIRLTGETDFADFVKTLAQVVSVDRRFESLRHVDSVEILNHEIDKVYSEAELLLSQIDLEDEPASDLLNAKRNVFLFLREVMRSSECRQDLLDSARKGLVSMKFEKSAQIIEALTEFSNQLRRAVQKYGSLQTISHAEETRLLDILKPVFPAMDGVVSKHASLQELRSAFSEMVSHFQQLPMVISQEAKATRVEIMKSIRGIQEKLEPKDKRPVQINFSPARIKIVYQTGETLLDERKKQPGELLEYLLIHDEPVHWIEGITALSDWRKIREDIPNLKEQWAVVVSRLRGSKGLFEQNRLGLDIQYLGKGFWKLQGEFSSNISKAKTICDEAHSAFDQGDPKEAKEKVVVAIREYEDCAEAHMLLVKLLGLVEFRARDLRSTRRFFLGQITALENTKKTLEYYMLIVK